MQIPLLGWLLQGIPEAFAITYLVVNLGLKQVPWRTVLKIGTIMSIAAYLIRLLPFMPGVHSVILIFVMSLVLTNVTSFSLIKSIVCSSVGIITLILCEFIFNGLLIVSGIVTVEQINNSVAIWVITGYPQVIMLFILGVVVNKKGIVLME